MLRRALPAGLVAALALSAPAHAGGLRAGVGRADITPRTGYFFMGWVDSRGKSFGQHTRLFARVIVLERDGKKLALVSEDLNGIPGGMLEAAAALVKDRGFSPQNVLDSASHTHAAPAGYYNYSTYNTVFMSKNTLTDFNVTGTLDPQLYAFMVRRLAEAIRRADDDLGPAAAGWGYTELLGVTQNRSLEAHLADYGISEARGTGNVSQDPLGYRGTIDPEVHVLRVDKLVHRRRVPVGIWSTFADHGTVDPLFFPYYAADHHGSATRVVEDTIRRKGHTPASQDVVNAYGNTDEGDQSAGLFHQGPAFADGVGRAEAAAMLRAWRSAGRRMSTTPALELRWNRVCFCGQDTEGGAIDSQGTIGLPQFTGSEEGTGPLYDVTHVSFEDRRLPVSNGAQGDKIPVVSPAIPNAVPLFAIRIANRMIVSVPGEMTVGMGRRVRDSVLAATHSAGIGRVVISGLANEYVNYFTTPEEYDRQHYEGGATVFGRTSSNFIKAELTDLATRLVSGRPAPDPYPFDPRNGISADAAPYDLGAASATVSDQPHAVDRLAQARFVWKGGPQGLDRPLDKPFVTIEQAAGSGHWRRYTDDLGLQITWRVDDGAYTARWEAPRNAPLGEYRFVITANRYRIASGSFAVGAINTLELVAGKDAHGRPVVRIGYPQPQGAIDLDHLTYRPPFATGGRVAYTLHGRRHVVRRSRSEEFAVPLGAQIAPGAAEDRYGNSNLQGATVQ